MADIKISELQSAASLDGSEVMPASQGVNPVKISVGQISAKMQSDVFPIGTDKIKDASVSLQKFTQEAKNFIGSSGNIVNNPDGVTLESYVDGGTSYIRVAAGAAEALFSTGVKFDWSQSGTALTRVGNTTIGQSMITDMVTPVILNDDGTVNYELGTDIRYKADGHASVLTGADGQAMLRIKKFYIKRVFDGSNRLTELRISRVPLPGYILHEKFSWGNGRDEIFVGLFEASLVSSKMASVSEQPIYSSTILAQFRSAAVARGTGWHAYDYYTQDLLQTLWYIYFADMNSQVSLPGYTGMVYNQLYLRNTGRSSILQTVNGYIPADATLDSDIYSLGTWTDSTHAIANRFLWIENLFGHVWKICDGVSYDGRIAGQKHAFTTPDYRLFSSDQTTILNNYKDLGIPIAYDTSESWLKSFGYGFNPIEFGGGSSNYTADYFWCYLNNQSRDYLRPLCVGGALSYGPQAGVACRSSGDDLGHAHWTVGSRLCFEKN